jgi:hypothetical protein
MFQGFVNKMPVIMKFSAMGPIDIPRWCNIYDHESLTRATAARLDKLLYNNLLIYEHMVPNVQSLQYVSRQHIVNKSLGIAQLLLHFPHQWAQQLGLEQHRVAARRRLLHK